jgi:hypothetical protein
VSYAVGIVPRVNLVTVRSALPIPELFAGGLTAAAALPYEERIEKGRCMDPNSDYFASDEIEYFSTFCRGRCGASPSASLPTV